MGRLNRRIRNATGIGLLAAAWISGCGGGSGTKAPPDFSVLVSASTLTVANGGPQQTVTLSATAQNGFMGTVGVAINGVPGGVTVSPASLNLTPGTPQQVSFAASASS